MHRWGVLVLVLASGLAPHAALPVPAIGVFADPAAASCNITQTGSGPGTFYLLSLLGGAVADGISQAEFRVDGFPAAWGASVTPNPAAFQTLGAPLNGGGTILFPACQTGSGGVVLLYTVAYYAAGPEVVSQYLNVFKTTIRQHPDFQCPLLTRCVGPPLVKLCATGVSGIINGPPCTVGVQPATWSQVKNLFD